MGMSQGGGTPRAEAILEERRRVLRNALKGEFIRKKYDPKAYTADGGVVFDAAMQRWNAMQFTFSEFGKPTFTNFTKFCGITVLPIVAFYQFCFGEHHKAYIRAIQRGEVAYNAESRKFQWFGN